MPKAAFTLLILFLAIQSSFVQAQTENFKKGMEAVQNNRYHEAMISFTKVVEDEKYEVSGKDLSLAHAYLAVIRTAYLEKDLLNTKFENIVMKQGQIAQTIAEMVRAIKFQDKNTISLIDESKQKLVSVSIKAMRVLGDSLMSFDTEKPNETTDYIASFALKQFGELENIDVDNWEVHDILGLSHFFLNEKERSMQEFSKARDQFNTLTEPPVSYLHLRNFILSSEYNYENVKDKKLTKKICEEGSKYTSYIIDHVSDDNIKEILELNKIENKLRQYINKL